MAIDEHLHRLEEARKPGYGIGLLKGMRVLIKHLFKRNDVIEYPDEKQDLSPRTRGVIALKEENCTVCMLCGRECPDWCIYIDSHKETLPPKRAGGRPRKRNVLDRFAIDYALCMYCGICVEVCPYDALFWSREFEYAEYDIRQLTHEKERLADWMATVLPPPELDDGAELPGRPAAAAAPATPTAAPTDARPAASAPGTEAKPAPETAKPAPETAKPAPELAEEVKAEEADATAEARAEPEVKAPAPEPAPAEPAAPQPKPSETLEDPEAAYKRVLEEQLGVGASPQVAEARAKVARVKAERGIARSAGPAPAERPVESAPAATPSEPEPSEDEGGSGGSSETRRAIPPGPESEDRFSETRSEDEGGPVAPTPAETAEEAEPAASAETTEDPDAVYESVLAAERAKGSSDAVATARAKAARLRAIKGTKGPEG